MVELFVIGIFLISFCCFITLVSIDSEVTKIKKMIKKQHRRGRVS